MATKSKKVSYVELLKEAMNEFDTTKAVDVKGPMLDPILAYDGGGELETNKDAASILERYYFNKEDDGIVRVFEAEENEIDEVPPKEDSGVAQVKNQIEKEVTEQEENTEEEPPEEEEEEVEEATSIENAVIEKLIAEMEEEGDEGAGTKAAGTGDAEKDIPPRKDVTGESECPDCDLDKTNSLLEQETDEEETDEEEKELDVDKEVSEVGPVGNPETAEEKELEETFKLFREEIEEDMEEEETEEEETEEEEE